MGESEFGIYSYSLACIGEHRNGDLIYTRKLTDTKTLLLLADFAGHGNDPFRIAASIKNHIKSKSRFSLLGLLEEIDQKLRNQSHAAVLLGILDSRKNRLNYYHIGDIYGRFSSSANITLFGQPGMVGIYKPTPKMHSLFFEKNSTLILCTDGIEESWLNDETSDLGDGTIYIKELVKKHRKARDDASCLIIRKE